VGVDPQSRNAILQSVDDLGREGLAVLYTTHYMEEAERLCDRVGIIDEGRLVAEGTRRELLGVLGDTGRVRLEGVGPLDRFADTARHLDGVAGIAVVDGAVDVTVADGRRAIATLIDAAESAGVEVGAVEVVEADLEAVFLPLTGQALRD
jgi:ABC-2 type transport system ATP-binding protein